MIISQINLLKVERILIHQRSLADPEIQKLKRINIIIIIIIIIIMCKKKEKAKYVPTVAENDDLEQGTPTH